jgi:three-Cys-motif partner protein
MSNDDFFKEQSPSSRIKANVVASYFPKYCNIIDKHPQDCIRYVDFFSGPGVYDNGAYSTPLLIADACKKPPLCNKVQFIFNDQNYSEELKREFLKKFPAGTFKYEPTFLNRAIGGGTKESEYMYKALQNEKNQSKKNPAPTLLFFDPFGYKEIEPTKLAKFLSYWGNELFLFLNLKRLNAAILNDKFASLIKQIFPNSFETIREERALQLSVNERLKFIIDCLVDEFNIFFLKNDSQSSPLKTTVFRFQEEDSKTTSHCIIHFTKHYKGFELVKQIFYDFDNTGAELDNDGYYTYDSKLNDAVTLFAGAPTQQVNVDVLASKLAKEFAGRKLNANTLFKNHQTKGNYAKTHYVAALRKLVESGELEATFTDNANHRRSVLLNQHCILKFKSNSTT